MSNDKTGAVAERFLATPEAEEWQAFTQAVQEVLEKAGTAETISVPAGFLRRVIGEIAADPLMFEHLLEAWNRAAEAAGVPEERK